MAHQPSAQATADSFKKYNLMYYVKGALAGGICCSITHASLCPVDVVKTRIQLDPIKYNKGLLGSGRMIVAQEGAGALASGLGATAAGYFVQGWFKFGGVEFFKVNFVKALGDKKAWDNRTSIYLASSAMAEFIADLFLCPLEAIRIKSVSDPAFPKGVAGGIKQVMATQGVAGLYAGLGPILFKQVPYTMAKFAVQGKAAEAIYTATGSTPETSSKAKNIGISLGSGVVAGVAAAVVSHPADTLLSMINKQGGDKSGSTTTRLIRLARETGFVKLCTVGLIPRCVMIGTLTAGQFGIFDTVMNALGAEKFHFHNPDDHSGKH
jgi:solute carrier family 25 phosphate transporter 3